MTYDIYSKSIIRFGACKICKKEASLRMGVCFDCSDHVDGESAGYRFHNLWDKRNRENSWFAFE
jgi:hypothetical protein